MSCRTVWRKDWESSQIEPTAVTKENNERSDALLTVCVIIEFNCGENRQSTNLQLAVTKENNERSDGIDSVAYKLGKERSIALRPPCLLVSP